MNCRETTEGLAEYLENALPRLQRQGTERHLARCEPCHARLEQLLHLRQVARDLPPEQIPAAAKSNLLCAFREGKSSLW